MMHLPPIKAFDKSSLTPVITPLAVTSFALVVLINAWLYEDAYITFRVVDNFINGYGLTWNINERVQAYTHPLWMFLLAGVYFFTHEIFYSSMLLSVAVSVSAILVFVFGLATSPQIAWLGIAIFTMSKAFVDYSTSGLENPLAHLMLILFLFVYQKHEFNLKSLFFLALFAALSAFNRMDTLLLFLPALLYALFKVRTWKGLLVVGLGFLPFILWECFSLLYYGFLFPNTAYAKLYTGVSDLALIEAGLHYLLNSLTLDPVTLPIIIAGITMPFITKRWADLPIAIGVILYLIYLVKIGGDYISGRFLTVPLVSAVVLLLNSPTLSRRTIRLKPVIHSPVWALLLAVVCLAGLVSPYSPLLRVDYGPDYDREQLIDRWGIEDQRARYFPYASLLKAVQHPDQEWPQHEWVTDGKEARLAGPAAYFKGPIGFFGFFAGPEVHIVDKYALADPLLARLPPAIELDLYWRVGHFKRRLPDGYLETAQTGQNRITEKNVAAYYDKLALVTRGPLFDSQRWAEIWRLNTNQYAHLLADYPPMFQVSLPSAHQADDEGIGWDTQNNLTRYAGIQIDLDRLYHTEHLEITLVDITDEPIKNRQGDYQFVFCQGDLELEDIIFSVSEQIPEEGSLYTMEIPSQVSAAGFDRIQIFPVRGENIHNTINAITHLRVREGS
jgi:arabinofuranosyltransferase